MTEKPHTHQVPTDSCVAQPRIVASSSGSELVAKQSSGLEYVIENKKPSSGSAEGMSGGILSRYPTHRDIVTPGQKSIDALDHVPEDYPPLGNVDDAILGLQVETDLLLDANQNWTAVDDGRNLQVDFGLGSSQPIDSTLRHLEIPEPTNDTVLNGLEYNKASGMTGPLSNCDMDEKVPQKRQARYREKRKKKAKESEERLEQLKQQIEELQKQNQDINLKNQSLLMMHSYLDASVHQVGLKPENEKEQKHDDIIDGIKEKNQNEKKRSNFGSVFERLMGPFMDVVKEPGICVLENLATYAVSHWGKEARANTQIKIQDEMSTYLRYYFNASSDEERKKYERKMQVFIQTRIKLANFMFDRHPEFVMARVLDGWVEEGFNPLLLGEDRVEIEPSCISCLISDLGLSKSQIDDTTQAWVQFLSSWNDEMKVHNDLVENLEQGTEWGSLYENGMHFGVHSSLKMGKALNEFNERSKRRAMLILRLSNKLYTLLSPVQIARLGTFYPAHTPNWACVASVIVREYSSQGSSLSRITSS
jgi:hypothetical protein